MSILLLTVALCLHSASGASVVAIDNKIEQAMVSFHTFLKAKTRGDTHSL